MYKRSLGAADVLVCSFFARPMGRRRVASLRALAGIVTLFSCVAGCGGGSGRGSSTGGSGSFAGGIFGGKPTSGNPVAGKPGVGPIAGGGAPASGTGTGGGTTPPGTGPGVSGAPVSDVARIAAFRAAETELSALQNLDVPARNQQMVSFLKRQSVFEDAGIARDGSIWARFTDNRLYVINDTFEPKTPPAGRAPHRQAKMSVSAASRPANADPVSSSVSMHTARRIGVPTRADTDIPLPDTVQVHLLNALDSALLPPIDALNTMFTKRNYKVTVEDATLENLKYVRNEGVLHISSHGGTAEARDKSNVFAVFSSTEVTPENDQKYRTDMDQARLVYFTAANGYNLQFFKDYQTHYAITPGFIQFYGWTFAKNSIAFMNFCWSDAGGFTTALHDLSRGATITAGWSNAANPDKAWRAARYLFDRMLGTNSENPKETGNQRPFDFGSVFADLQAKGFADATTQQFGPCTLVGSTTAGNAILAPSIETMDVKEYPTLTKSTLTLHGIFGTGGTPSVTIGGTPVLAVTTFSSTQIECSIATKPGAGFAGNVVVSSDHGIHSNAVPLTVWEGDFKYAANILPTVPPVVNTLTVHAIIRDDVHEYRHQIGGDLQKQKAKPFRASLGSECHWDTTGDLPQGAIWVVNSGVMTYGLKNMGRYGSGYILEGAIDPSTSTMHIAFSFLGAIDTYQIPGAPVPDIDLALPIDTKIVSFASGVDHTTGELTFVPLVTANLGSDLTIDTGDVTGDFTALFDLHFRWNAIAPINGPDHTKGEDYDL